MTLRFAPVVALVILSIVFPMLIAPATAEEVITIRTRPGIKQSFILVEPAGKPVAAAILFPGGSGKIGLWRDPDRRTNNFLVRTRERFAAGGVLTAVVDVPSDRRRPGLSAWRDSEEHRADMDAVAQWLRQKAAVPVWLVGTSRGTISAAHLGAHLAVDGVVLTSSVTKSSRRNPGTALDAPLDRVKAPVLLVAHKQDGCSVTPAEGVETLKSALSASAKVEIMLFDGGDPAQSEPCQARSEHGFLGIEDKVVDAITGWMRGAGKR